MSENPESGTPDPLIAIGRVRRAVGLDGRLEVELYSGDISRLGAGTVVIAGNRSVEVEKATPSRKGLFSVHFKDVSDRNAADLLRGVELEVPESSVPQPPEGVYYHYQLVGSRVIDAAGRSIGTLSGIMETGANDVYVVSTQDGRDILVPATQNTVKEVDTVKRVITVDLPEAEADQPEEDDRDS